MHPVEVNNRNFGRHGTVCPRARVPSPTLRSAQRQPLSPSRTHCANDLKLFIISDALALARATFFRLLFRLLFR